MQTTQNSAASAVQHPVWRLEFQCHGSPFHWTGTAPSESLATTKALAELSDSYPDFNKYKARALACVQVPG